MGIRMGYPRSGSIFLNALHGCLDARDLLEDVTSMEEPGYAPKYKGNILTDATIAMEYVSTNWDILQASLIWHDRLFPWAMADAEVHGAKGLTGIRVDGVNDVRLEGVTIDNLIE